ncbi:MAG: hypothetical protein LBF58_01255 [Deltaproteobacteria bacterium]|jgi:pilus assembly protein CpaE|nr:hypothetical protein [Deltaproteobacteria bacterium]
MHFTRLSQSETVRPQAGLFFTDERMLDQFKNILEGSGLSPRVAVKVDQNGWDKISPGEFSSLEAVVFDLKGETDPVPKAKELLDRCRPDATVVVLGRQNDLGLYRNLKAIGVADYFAHPVPPDELAESLRRSLGISESKRQSLGRIIAVHGVSGGLGSALVSAGLGVVLAEDYDRQTAVVDTCLGSPAVETYLGINSPGNLSLLIQAEERLDQVLLEQVVLKPMERLSLLTGLSAPDARMAPDPKTVRRLAELLSLKNRCQIWRSQAGGPMEETILKQANLVVLLSGGSIPIARATQRAYAWIRERNPGARIILVYNQVTPNPAFPPEQLSKSLGLKFQLQIPFLKGLAEDLVADVPLSRPKHAFHKPLAALAREIMGKPSDLAAKGPWNRLRRIFQ